MTAVEIKLWKERRNGWIRYGEQMAEWLLWTR